MSISPLRGVFIGSQSLLIQCAGLFLGKGHLLKAIISYDPAVQRWAQEQGVGWISPAADLREQLQAEEFDYLFSIVHLARIPDEILALPRQLAINFHDGPLPDYAGLNAPAWAIMNGEREHGISWHLMSREFDEGDIVGQVRFPIAKGETALTLIAKCYQTALNCFDKLIDQLAGEGAKQQPQDLSKRRYFGKYQRPPAAGSIDWSQPAETIVGLVNGLNFGPYSNPLTTAKIWIGENVVSVTGIERTGVASNAPAGTVTDLSHETVTAATCTEDVALRGFRSLIGVPVTVAELQDEFALRQGSQLRSPDELNSGEFNETVAAWSKHEEFWKQRLYALEPVEIPFAEGRDQSIEVARFGSFRQATPADALSQLDNQATPGDLVMIALTFYLARIGGKKQFDIAYTDPSLTLPAEAAMLFARHVPWRIEMEPQERLDKSIRDILARLENTRKHRSYALDLIQREPDLVNSAYSWHRDVATVSMQRVTSVKEALDESSAELSFIIPDDGKEIIWRYHENLYGAEIIGRMQDQVASLMADLAAAPRSVSELTVSTVAETEQLFHNWNRTERAYDREACVHELFEAQVEKTPHLPAVIFKNETLDYASLNAKANQLSHYLIAQGAGPGCHVGVLLNRSAEMVISLMAILKAGAAYVPLDPDYPQDRLAFMVEDAGVETIVSTATFEEFLGDTKANFVALDRIDESLGQQPVTNPDTDVNSNDLAYVIYTSGSTGKPKGVMVEHRNVVNFFVGMDEQLGSSEPGVWLAVTSVSFDISVLEIFWTLARGFQVVLFGGEEQSPSGAQSPSSRNYQEQAIEFSLFYFASDEAEPVGSNKYDLLLEGARFADQNGFSAVWTPERHFHAFGGLYPNPSVASAAIAAVTDNVKIRAGSCVLPLHNPIRIAEEWSLVDNLSNGRVGISFAAGWQPNDFVLAPQNYDQRHQVFEEGIETVRALWRGESRTFPGPKGDTTIKILPRPVQAELPFWVTAAGNPETFRKAGTIGANMLTHLLGQNVEELTEKLVIYRQAWRENGHPGRGHVTLMLHSFVAEDESEVRRQVHEPLKNYLRTATNLVKQYASTFPTFKNVSREGVDDVFNHLSEHDLEALLEHAFERYYQTSGLFGTPDSCLATVDRLKGIGVDEIACLIDFGIPSEVVLSQLPQLNALRQLSQPEPQFVDYGIPALMERHGVSHLQCTPSLATMLSKNKRARAGLSRIKTLMVGGEAFPLELAKDLDGLVDGRVLNMYGPTETTIWSGVHELNGLNGNSVPIGKPIANTQIYIMDEYQNPLPPGVPGELMIGGDGVVRGYLGRPELTKERFIDDPLHPDAKLYRTGDLARQRRDGVLEFLGRMDHQVKIRGHRIELGEIETILGQHTGVQQGVVVAREDKPGDKRLVGYYIREPGQNVSAASLRELLQRHLPDFMVPASIVKLDAFPLTPNKKIDRNNLPTPDQHRPELGGSYVAPRTETEKAIASFFGDVLGLERVGIHDNFTELGGDSLTAVEVFLKIQETFRVEFPLHTFFQIPTVAGLAERLDESLHAGSDSDALPPIETLIEHHS